MEIIKTMKLHLCNISEQDSLSLKDTSSRYMEACNFISQYIFGNGFVLNFMDIQKALYDDIRSRFNLKSQMTISAIKTVTARYKAVKEQLAQKPYKYKDENGNWQYIIRTLDWLIKPVSFHRLQADFVRGRDYSFVNGGESLSLNTLDNRIKVKYDVPDYFKDYFDGTWSFGTGKIVSLNGEWYFHIPMTKAISQEFSCDKVKHVVGIDRGLRFLAATYDEKGKCGFIDGKQILKKRDSFAKVRAQLQRKGTKSAKRALKRISGRENRWASDVNHRVTKTLCNQYGANTLFVLEDLTDVSFAEENLNRSKGQNRELRSWAFYQFEFDLEYKAKVIGSTVIKVPSNYTSQRCPKCGRIHKENRKHNIHEYICDCCGYRSNDDRIGAMNLQFLGTWYISGVENPHFSKPKAIN